MADDELDPRGRGQLDRARERAFRLVAAHYGGTIEAELNLVLREVMDEHVDDLGNDRLGELMSLILALTWTIAGLLEVVAEERGISPQDVLRAGEKGLEGWLGG